MVFDIEVFAPGLSRRRRRGLTLDPRSYAPPALLWSLGLPVPPGFSLGPRGLAAVRGGSEQALSHLRSALAASMPGLSLPGDSGAGRCRLHVVPPASLVSEPRIEPNLVVGHGASPSAAERLASALAALDVESVSVLVTPLDSNRLPRWLVCWSRDPGTGGRRLSGEYAEGPTVACVRAADAALCPLAALTRCEPSVRAQIAGFFEGIAKTPLACHELELLLEGDRLLVVGARPPSLGPAAAARIAFEMADSGLWSRRDAVAFLGPEQLHALSRPEPRRRVVSALPVVARGASASTGFASGAAVLTAEQARRFAEAGRKVVLLSSQLCPEDVAAVGAGGAVVTSARGVSLPGARAARSTGVPVVAVARLPRVGEGEWVTVDGAKGIVRLGEPRLSPRRLPACAATILMWADGICAAHGVSFRVNADSGAELRRGMRFGGRGVGLCRTERMLAGPRELALVRRSIIAPEEADRARALAELGAMYRLEFGRLLRASRGDPVTIRLLDPTLEELVGAVPAAPDGNPVAGLRGCRVGLLYPGLYDTQVRSLFEAACSVVRGGAKARPEILVPLVTAEGEVEVLRRRIESVAAAACSRWGLRIACRVGAMVEVPRAAVLAGRLARHADFICLGTNDLTQMTLGVSREDVGKFLAVYMARGIWPRDPFRSIDDGVLDLVKLSASRIRAERSNVPIGLCGEHAADPASIRALLSVEEIPVDYLSCSPDRLPVARLAAAQALLGRSATSATRASRKSKARRSRARPRASR